MSAIFVSYKREDEARVGVLVRALQSAGLSVWWDRGLPGGENWRAQIQTALDAAPCVIVVWTHASVDSTGDFVRDEAAQAKRRGVLVPVRLDVVDPPVGFGELQAVDLTRWKGQSRDPFFCDLVAAVTAKRDGRPVPPAQGPMARLARRAVYGSLVSATIALVSAFGINQFHLQNRVCGAPLFQPRLSDACGALGLGDRPNRDERIAWELRAPGSCPDLRALIERFPTGTHRAEAASLLAARRVTQTEAWEPADRRLVLFVGQDGPSANEAAARLAASRRAKADAERLCRGFAATQSFRLRTWDSAPQKWDCSRVPQGVTCGFEGEAVCGLDLRRTQDVESCGR